MTGAIVSMFRPDDLLPRLKSEFGYPDRGARTVAEQLALTVPVVREVFYAWWRGGELKTEFQVEGYSVQDLMDYGMNPIAAFLTLDWLAREPENAQASLRRGYDSALGRPKAE